MSSFGAFYSTDPKSHSIPHHPSTQQCPMSFVHKLLPSNHDYSPPQKGDLRSVCPALNAMANHGYIPRDGRNLTFFTIFYGLQACYGLSTPLAIVLTLGGFLLISRSPICLPFTVPKWLSSRNPDGSTSQPGVIDLRLIGLHGRVEHDASLVHEDCCPGSKYPSTVVRQDWVENLVADVLPTINITPCSSHVKNVKEDDGDASLLLSSSIISRLVISDSHRRGGSDSSSDTAVADDGGEFDGWKQYTSKQYLGTLVSAADVGRMRARREREIAPKSMDPTHAEIARGEMAIILGVWEQSGTVKKGIPLSYLLTWLAEERLPEGWRPDHVQGLFDVMRRSRAIKSVSDAVVKARSC